jgi:hypothetical protein
MKYLASVANKLRRGLDLPPGYSVKVDHKTDNLIVESGIFGFAVTRRFIEDHDDILTPVKEQLERLKEATAAGYIQNNENISSLEQLAAEREGSTVFDSD